MAEIKNYTLNFSCGHSLCEFNFSGEKLAFAEIQRLVSVQLRSFNG